MSLNFGIKIVFILALKSLEVLILRDEYVRDDFGVLQKNENRCFGA